MVLYSVCNPHHYRTPVQNVHPYPSPESNIPHHHILTQRSYHLLHVSNTGDERSHPPSFIPIPPSLMMAKCLGFTSVHRLNLPAPMSHHIGWKAFWTAAPPGHDHPAKGSPCLSTGRTWPMAYSQRSHLHYCHQYHPERPIQAIYSYSIY